MVPELLQGTRRKSNIGEEEGNDEEEADFANEDISHEDGGNTEEEVKHEVPHFKVEFDAGLNIGADTESWIPNLSSSTSGFLENHLGGSLGAIPRAAPSRPSVIRFQRSTEHLACHAARPNQSREGGLTPVVPEHGMAVSGDKHFSKNIC